MLVAFVVLDAARVVELLAGMLVCQPRFLDNSYHQFRYIHPSKSVIWVALPANMMKLVTPVGVQSVFILAKSKKCRQGT